jgi:hypothetical protein
MADDKTKTGAQDRASINPTEDYEVRDWAKRFGVSADEPRAAVKAVGPMASDVEQRLRQRRAA